VTVQFAHYGYSDPPTFEDYLDFVDRCRISPDTPHMLKWSAEELCEQANGPMGLARKDCTVELAQAMLEVEWPTGDGVVVGTMTL